MQCVVRCLCCFCLVAFETRHSHDESETPFPQFLFYFIFFRAGVSFWPISVQRLLGTSLSLGTRSGDALRRCGQVRLWDGPCFG